MADIYYLPARIVLLHEPRHSELCSSRIFQNQPSESLNINIANVGIIFPCVSETLLLYTSEVVILDISYKLHNNYNYSNAPVRSLLSALRMCLGSSETEKKILTPNICVIMTRLSPIFLHFLGLDISDVNILTRVSEDNEQWPFVLAL